LFGLKLSAGGAIIAPRRRGKSKWWSPPSVNLARVVLLTEDSPSRDEIPEFALFLVIETCGLHVRSKQRQRSKKASQPGMTETLLGGEGYRRIQSSSFY
jgi:hypothetical protein